MVLSTKAKESIKTALAMVIAYGIALAMDWDKPMWAAFVVAFISLATVGQSLNKGAMRMLGTLVGTVVAFVMIAAFAQDRWLFIVFLSAWLGFCVYLMGGTKYGYFWNLCGLVCVIISFEGGPNSNNAFQIAMLRAQETGLGVLAYTVVIMLVWPSSAREPFADAASKLASTHHQLYGAYVRLMSGQNGAAEAQALRAQEMQLQTQFGQLLDAAESDTYEVWEMRRQWRDFQRHSAQLSETMERWHDSFVDVQALDLQRLLPNLPSFSAELDARLAQIEGMLAGQTPTQYPVDVELSVDRAALTSLPHFHTAALAVALSQLEQLAGLTRSLFDIATALKGGDANAHANDERPTRAPFALDPDRAAGAIHVMATMWLAYLIWIYVPDLPGGTGFVIMAGAMGMVMVSMPPMSVWRLYPPVAAATAFAALLYMFVMPELSSFPALALLIFAVTFAICYLYAAPQQALGRTFGLAMFLMITSISNQQTYSFLGVANTALLFPLVFLFLGFTAYIPFSPRPEHVFLRLLGRFFRSCEFLTSDMHGSSSRVDRWRWAFHVSEVETLPGKLGTWVPHLDTALAGTTPERVQSLVISLQALGYRMEALLEARDTPQAPLLVQELREDIRVWHRGVQDTFEQLSGDPTVAQRDTFRAGLAAIMNRLEDRIRATLDKAPDQFTEQDGENFYGMLGAYRGVSEALVDYAGSTGEIDWSRWREERF